MDLPVSNDYLAHALRDELEFRDLTLRHRTIGELKLPTGRLVACDPLVDPEAGPFTMPLPPGTFPVVLSVAHFADDQRVAFALIRFRTTAPVSWELMTVGEQNLATLMPGHSFGYPVDSGTGCFLDASTASRLEQRMQAEENYYETIIASMDRNYVHTWNWCDLQLGDGNLLAFSSGFGDGLYATYVGHDQQGDISAVVTDFGVAPR